MSAVYDRLNARRTAEAEIILRVFEIDGETEAV